MTPKNQFQFWIHYHQTTFLQSFTIDFPLLFPHPSILSELSKKCSKSMSAFLFGDILLCNSLQKVLVLFAILWCASRCQIQSHLDQFINWGPLLSIL